MRKTFILFVTLSLGAYSCASKSDDYSSAQDAIVKIIKTKCYSTRTSFDKLDKDKPEYDMGYDETIEMDFSFSTKYLDKYDNVIKLENFMLDSTGNERIYRTTTYQYYSPEKKQLALVKIKSDYGNEENKYIRDNTGLLIEIIKSTGEKMFEKTVYKYSSSGQAIKKEVYREKGLKESFEYIYDSPKKDSGRIIKEIETNYGPSFTVEREYRWTEEGKNTSTRIKEFENGQLLSDLTFYYKKNSGDIVTEEVIEGYNAPLKEVSQDGTVKKIVKCEPFRGTTIKTIDKHYNILTYSYSTEDLNEKGQVIPKKKLGLLSDIYPNPRIYECKYTYNQKGDWIELLFSADNQKYLVFREIKYL